MIYNITIQENKTIQSDNDILLNQFENEIDELHFTFPFEDFGWVGVFKSPSNSKLEIPIIDNKIIIDKTISSQSGIWELILVGKKDEIVFISNIIQIKSNRNHLNLKTIQEQDINIKNLYLEIQDTLKKLNTTGISEISDLLTEINEIKEKVDNTEVLNKLNTTQNMLQSLITMTNGMISQVLNGTNRLPDMNTTLTENNNNIKDLQKKIGNDTDKNDGTLFHHAYWSMIRSEQSNNNTLSRREKSLFHTN